MSSSSVRRVARTLVIAGAVAILVGGCADRGSGSDASRALYAIGSRHKLCMAPTGAHALVEGLDTIANRGPAPVHVDGAQWLNIKGLDDVRIAIFQRESSDQFDMFGTWRGYPPVGLAQEDPTLEAAWKRRTPAAGASLPASDATQHYFNLVVSWSGDSGSAGPIELRYTDAAGHHGTVKTFVTLVVKTTCGLS